MIYNIYIIKYLLYLLPIEFCLYYISIPNSIYNIIYLLYICLLFRQNLNLLISDSLIRLFIPIKNKNKNNNNNFISISDKIKCYISYFYLNIIIYIIIFFFKSNIIIIFFKGYIHGHMTYIINDSFSINNITEYKYWFFIYGLIEQYFTFFIPNNFNSIKFCIILYFNYLFDLYNIKNYLNIFFIKIYDFKYINNKLSIIIKILWKISNVFMNGTFSKSDNSSILKKIYINLLSFKNINNLYKIILWKEYHNLNNLLNYSPLSPYSRIFLNDLLFCIYEINKILYSLHTIKIIYNFPILTDIITYFINIDKKIINIFKDTQHFKLILNEINKDIINALNTSNIINSTSSLKYEKNITYTNIDMNININENYIKK